MFSGVFDVGTNLPVRHSNLAERRPKFVTAHRIRGSFDSAEVARNCDEDELLGFQPFDFSHKNVIVVAVVRHTLDTSCCRFRLPNRVTLLC
jgi:hypothetical protein